MVLDTILDSILDMEWFVSVSQIIWGDWHDHLLVPGIVPVERVVGVVTDPSDRCSTASTSRVTRIAILTPVYSRCTPRQSEFLSRLRRSYSCSCSSTPQRLEHSISMHLDRLASPSRQSNRSSRRHRPQRVEVSKEAIERISGRRLIEVTASGLLSSQTTGRML